jgi:uncharacterized membrane protein YgcG
MKLILRFLLALSCSWLLQAAVSDTTSVPAASTPAPPPSAAAKLGASELEKLAMPIALHPDPLISIILPASVFPVEIVLAARFVKDTNNISKLDAQPWDENVKAVARFPELIAKMSADLDWTVALGQAFLDQRKELMDTIQSLRMKAQQAGTLKTTEQQIVTVTNTVVEKIVEQQAVVVTNTIVQIQPSNPEVIYVPSYPPAVYYPPPVYAYSYGYAYYPYAAPLMTFGAGMLWGAAIANWNHCNWGGGDVDVDINRNTNINRDRNTNIGSNRPQPRSGDRTGGQRSWQPDSNRLRSSGAPSAATREARGWNNPSGAGGARPSQRPSTGAGARPSQQPAFSGSQRPTARTQPSRSASASQRPATSQRPSSAARPSTSSYNRSASQRSSAFSGVGGGGGSTRSYSNRGSYSRGGGGFSGGGRGGGGGGRGGGRR